VRRCELVTHPLGFGDVGDGGHPAGLVALGVDQGGDVHARIELAAVASLHVEFNAPCGASTQQFLLEHAVEFVDAVAWPVRVGRAGADEFVLGKACHGTEGRVDVGDAPLQIDGAHAGEHGVFHGAPEVGFLHQSLLDFGAPTHVAQGAHQCPDGEQGQGDHHPEQGAPHQAGRGLEPHAAQQQTVADGSDDDVVNKAGLGGSGCDGTHRTGDQVTVGSHQAHGMTLQDLLRHLVAHERFQGVLGNQRPRKALPVHHGQMQLNRLDACGVEEGLGVGRLVALTRLRKGLAGLARLVQRGVMVCLVFERVAVDGLSGFEGQGERRAHGLDLFVGLHPRQAQHLRTRAHKVAGLEHELLDGDGLEIDVACQALHMLLVLDEA